MAINFKKGIKSICESLGKNNNPAYVVVAIATAKGIFRPLFTMTDKKESIETKKYAALREGLTEVIAIPTYLLCGAIAGKGAALVKDPTKAKMARHNLQFVGVCTAALLVIPGLCSLFVKPFTDKIFHKGKEAINNQQAQLYAAPKSINPVFQSENFQNHTDKKVYAPTKVTMSTFFNHGMRVG